MLNLHTHFLDSSYTGSSRSSHPRSLSRPRPGQPVRVAMMQTRDVTISDAQSQWKAPGESHGEVIDFELKKVTEGTAGVNRDSGSMSWAAM
jgi:hypothetical protein